MGCIAVGGTSATRQCCGYFCQPESPEYDPETEQCCGEGTALFATVYSNEVGCSQVAIRDTPRASIRAMSNVVASTPTTCRWFAVCTSCALRRANGGSALCCTTLRHLRVIAAPPRQASNCFRQQLPHLHRIPRARRGLPCRFVVRLLTSGGSAVATTA